MPDASTVPTQANGWMIDLNGVRLTNAQAGEALLRSFFGGRGCCCRRRCRLCASSLLRRLQFADHRLQARHRSPQGLDLAVRGIETLLLVESQLPNALLQEIDVTLQAAG